MSQGDRSSGVLPPSAFADDSSIPGFSPECPSQRPFALAHQHRKFRALLEEVTRLSGGDPARPDWAPEDGVELLRALVGDHSDLRLVSAEKRAVQRALQATKGNIRAAARQLQIGKTTLYRKIRDFDLVIPCGHGIRGKTRSSVFVRRDPL